MKKSVLYIAFYFPPQRAVGAIRSYSFSSELKKNGYAVTVLTNKNRDSEPVLTPVKSEGNLSGFVIEEAIDPLVIIRKKARENIYKKKNLNGYKTGEYLKNKLPVIDLYFFWAFMATLKLFYLRYIQKTTFDYIVSSSPPLSAHSAGLWAKRLYPNAKWIADFRDIDGQHSEYTYTRYFFGNPTKNKTYKQIVQKADCLTVVSEGQQDLLIRHANADNKKLRVIYNGHSLKLESARIGPTTKNYELVFSGSFRSEFFSLSLLNQAYLNLEPEEKLSITFLGHVSETSQAFIKEKYPHLTDHFKFIGTVPHSDIITHLASAKGLVLVDYLDSYGILQTKTYDYIASGTPILFLVDTKNPDSELAKLIRLGIKNSVLTNSEDTFKAIKKLQSKGDTSTENYPKEVFEFYSRENQNKRFLEVIKSL